MSNTRHIHKQISSVELSTRIELLLDEMLPAKARESMTLTSRDRRELIRKLAEVREELERLSRKGGCVVVLSEDHEITTYRVDSYRPRLYGHASEACKA